MISMSFLGVLDRPISILLKICGRGWTASSTKAKLHQSPTWKSFFMRPGSKYRLDCAWDWSSRCLEESEHVWKRTEGILNTSKAVFFIKVHASKLKGHFFILLIKMRCPLIQRFSRNTFPFFLFFFKKEAHMYFNKFVWKEIRLFFLFSWNKCPRKRIMPKLCVRY